MKLIEKLRGSALNAANVRIAELEEELDNAKSDGIIAWNRLSQCREEKAELKRELEKTQNASQRKREMLNQGRHCNTCKHQTETGRFAKNGRPITGCNKQACEGYEARE